MYLKTQPPTDLMKEEKEDRFATTVGLNVNVKSE